MNRRDLLRGVAVTAALAAAPPIIMSSAPLPVARSTAHRLLLLADNMVLRWMDLPPLPIERGKMIVDATMEFIVDRTMYLPEGLRIAITDPSGTTKIEAEVMMDVPTQFMTAGQSLRVHTTGRVST